MTTTIAQRFACRRRTKASWTSLNEVLLVGEWGVETDQGNPQPCKLGDGSTPWNSLPYANPAAFIASAVVNGDTTHAPSGDAVFDAIAAEAAARDTAIAAAVAGLSWKQAVRAATTVAGTMASSFENGDTIDGVVLATGDRILVKNQAAPADNGIYTVNASGAPTRASDANSGSELVSASVYISEGTTLADTQWTCTTNAPITPGVTSLAFAQLSTGGMPNFTTTQRIGARKTAGSGAMEECTLSEVLDFIGSAAQGDILYRGAASWARLGAGTNGHLLSTQGAGANPQWIAPGSASVGVGAQVGYARAQTSTPVNTTDTTIPRDNTKPQSGEGVAWAALDTTITPAASANLLRVTLTIPMIGTSAAASIAFAIFRDSDTDATWATFVTAPTAGQMFPHTFSFTVPAGTTSATTFKVRWATSNGTAYLLQNNGATSYFNGLVAGMLEVVEIKQ